MALRVYDTLRQKKTDFQPVHPGKVGMYVCGMTVQDKPHMGHMLAFVSGDMIRRYLEYLGYEVTYIQNFTDIDDKIIDRANQEGVDYRVVVDRNIEAYHRIAKAVNIKPATLYPYATRHMDEIIAMVAKLVEGGHAYEAGGDVYFRVRTKQDYGKLSKRDIDDLISGARVEVGENKQDPLDFALWKASKPGEPAWDSPWGKGRPGWHIECSAMATKYLGATLDLHGGGEDLIFPHHENELAQSECATGREFVRHWMHNGLLNLRGQKMSKSTGHFFAMEDVLREFDGQVVRFYLLSTHFRSQMEYSRERLEASARTFERLVNACRSLDELRSRLGDAVPLSTSASRELVAAAEEARENFLAAMDDDFNSAGAIGYLFELIKTYNISMDENGSAVAMSREALDAVWYTLDLFDQILGLFREGLPRAVEAVPAEVQAKLDQRNKAKKEKDFQLADRLRDEIQADGWVILDTQSGSTLRRK
ncbi:MAG TPA: cysteine--tRNA ligase [Candidatus Krumholzibacteria bacterium]|nr:cysteine--tRNA ligase [Candidatus Krumholzibacteria bacterium]